MNQEKLKTQPAVGDIFMQEIKRTLSILESNSESVKTAMPTMLNRHIEEFGKTNASIQSVAQTIDMVRLRVDEIAKTIKQIRTSVDKDFKVVSDVLMDFEKQYDMMKDSIISTRRKTLAMFLFLLCNTVLSSFVLIKITALL